MPSVIVLIKAHDSEGYRATEEGSGATEQEAVIDALKSLTYNTQDRTYLLDGWAVCASDDPTNHQGDTCPIHEEAANAR